MTIVHPYILKIIKIGPTHCVGKQKKKFGINFNKSKTKFCLSFHYNGDAIYLCVNKTQTFKFKGIDNISLICLVQEAYLKVLQKMQEKDIALSGADMVFQLTTE